MDRGRNTRYIYTHHGQLVFGIESPNGIILLECLTEFVEVRSVQSRVRGLVSDSPKILHHHLISSAGLILRLNEYVGYLQVAVPGALASRT